MNNYLIAAGICALKGLVVGLVVVIGFAGLFAVMYLADIYGIKWVIGWIFGGFFFITVAGMFYACVTSTVERKRVTGKWW